MNGLFKEQERICYIVGAYESGEISIRKKEKDIILCADGGLDILKKNNIFPDVIMGDFDSLGYVPTGDNVYIYPSEKDDSDVGIAIDYGFDKGYKSFIIYGCIGGRFDHSFANVQLLARIAERGGRGWIIGEKTAITVIKNGELKISGKGYISVFSLSHKSEGVTLENLKYTLCNSTLDNSYPLGLSNEFINDNTPALLRVQSGVLLVVISE